MLFLSCIKKIALIDMEHKTNFKDLFNGIKENIPELSLKTMLELTPHLSLETLKKKEHFVKRGQFNNKIAFVVKGIFKAYVEKEDQEIVLWFRAEHTVFGSHQSTLANKPSYVSYQALEDSTIVTLPYSKLKEIASKDLTTAKSITAVLEHLVLELIQRLEEMIADNPTVRYQKFLEEYKTHQHRLPQKEIAGYIGITPESFSRLKSRDLK